MAASDDPLARFRAEWEAAARGELPDLRAGRRRARVVAAWEVSDGVSVRHARTIVVAMFAAFVIAVGQADTTDRQAERMSAIGAVVAHMTATTEGTP